MNISSQDGSQSNLRLWFVPAAGVSGSIFIYLLRKISNISENSIQFNTIILQ